MDFEPLKLNYHKFMTSHYTRKFTKAQTRRDYLKCYQGVKNICYHVNKMLEILPNIKLSGDTDNSKKIALRTTLIKNSKGLEEDLKFFEETLEKTLKIDIDSINELD